MFAHRQEMALIIVTYLKSCHLVIINLMSQKIANPRPEFSIPEASDSRLECNSSVQRIVASLPTLASIIFTDLCESNQQAQEQAEDNPQTSQFNPLGLMHASKLQRALVETATEESLKIGKHPNLVQTNLTSLQDPQLSIFPTKTVLLMRKAVKEYWEANRQQTPSILDQNKRHLFSYLLVAIFQIKSLSVEELRDEREILVFQLPESQLSKYATKVNEKLIVQISQHSSKAKQFWTWLLEAMSDMQNILIRRAAICQEDVFALFEQASQNKNQLDYLSQSALIKAKLIQGCESSVQNEETSLPGALPVIPKEQDDPKSESNFKITLQPIPNSEEPTNQNEDDNELNDNQSSDQKTDYNNFSIATEGRLTENDISLSMMHFDDSEALQSQPEPQQTR